MASSPSTPLRFDTSHLSADLAEKTIQLSPLQIIDVLQRVDSAMQSQERLRETIRNSPLLGNGEPLNSPIRPVHSAGPHVRFASSVSSTTSKPSVSTALAALAASVSTPSSVAASADMEAAYQAAISHTASTPQRPASDITSAYNDILRRYQRPADSPLMNVSEVNSILRSYTPQQHSTPSALSSASSIPASPLLTRQTPSAQTITRLVHENREKDALIAELQERLALTERQLELAMAATVATIKTADPDAPVELEKVKQELDIERDYVKLLINKFEEHRSQGCTVPLSPYKPSFAPLTG